MAQKNVVTICSIFFRPVHAVRNYKPFDGSTGYISHFDIGACRPGEHRTLKVGNFFQLSYAGEGKYNDVPTYCDSQNGQIGVAEDLVIEWAFNVLGGEGNRGPGIFMCAGDEPTAEELKAADTRQRAWCVWLCNQAEEDWIAGRKTAIQDVQREAAQWLGRNDYAWISDSILNEMRLRNCPNCAKQVNAEAWTCPNCQRIIDFDKAMAYMEKEEKLRAKMAELGMDLATSPKQPIAPPLKAVRA